MDQAMNLNEFATEVDSRLKTAIASSGLVLSEKSFDPARGKSILRWRSERLALEIYSDPKVGEVNCRVALLSEEAREVQWKFLFEYVPLTDSELRTAHTTFQSPAQQLDLVSAKLKIFLIDILGRR
jgi:hypothetical protein